MIAELPDFTLPSGYLEGRTILITGATRGIGRALAVEAARLGARVILCGRKVAELEKLHNEIADAGLPVPAAVALDLQKATVEDYGKIADALREESGSLDGLVHMAGLLGELSPIAHYPPLTWHNVMHVNVSAPFLLTRALLPLMEAADDASIVFASSSVGRQGRANWGAYAVSKFAVEGLMQTLADETDGQPRVNCVNPGATRTAMRASAFPAEDPKSLKTPEEIVGPFLFLLGADAAGINGQTFNAQ